MRRINSPPLERLRTGLLRLIHTKLWRMDIHPTAQIASTALIDRTWPKGIHIGANSRIGEEAVVLTHDMTRGIYYDTHIGAGCVLGARAIIMPGITIGDNCIVMPGALVTKDMPAGTTAIGNPAVLVGR
jgi:acetyltransferase-like isoleucine patch superfamily enzyme